VPAPYSHPEEAEALAFVPDPFDRDPNGENCRRLASAIRVLRAQLAWRKTDLNPESADYLGHVKRIAIIKPVLERLEESHRNLCGKDCPP
jgi:hypothetical protein